MAGAFTGLFTGKKGTTSSNSGGSFSGLGDYIKADQAQREQEQSLVDQAKKRAASRAYLASPEAVQPIHQAGAYGDKGVGGLMSKIDDFAQGISTVGLGIASNFLPDQSAGEKPEQVEKLKTALKTGDYKPVGQVGHAASNLDLGVKGVEDKLFLGGEGPALVKFASGLFNKGVLVKAGVDILKQAPEVYKMAVDPNVSVDDKISKVSEYLAGAGLTVLGAKGFVNEGQAAFDEHIQPRIDKAYEPIQTAADLNTIRNLPKEVPKTLKVTPEEYSQRFNDLSKNYDVQAKTAETMPALKRQVFLDQLDQEHQTALEQLDKDFKKGVPNPAYGTGQSVETASPTAGKGSAKLKTVAQDVNLDEGPGSFDRSELNKNARNVFQDQFEVKAGDTKAAPLARDFTSSVYHDLAAETQRAAKGLSKDNLKKIDLIESETPLSADEAVQRVHDVADTIKDQTQRQKFLDTVDSIRKGKDTRYLSDTEGLKRDVGYVRNHIDHVYEHNGKSSLVADGQSGEPGYTKGRVIATKAEADRLSKLTDEDGKLVYPHLKLADVDAVEAHIQSMKAAASEHGNQAFKQAIEQAHPGAIVGDKANGLYTHITTPDGVDISDVYNKRLTATKNTTPLAVRTADGKVIQVRDSEVAKTLKANEGSRLINAATNEDLHSNKIARIVRNLKDNPLGGYDKANAAIKTSVLGGGTFHGFTTAGTVLGQQLADSIKHPTTIPSKFVDNLKLIGGTLSKGQHDANMRAFAEAGVTDFARKVGTTIRSEAIDTDVGNPKIPVISQIHDAVFGRQIPEAKLMMTQQYMLRKFPDMDFSNPTAEQISYGRDVASAVNNIGGINRAVEGLTPNAAKHLSRFVLATDYTEGKFRTIASALTDAGPKGKIAREMVVGKAILFALPGLAAATAAGKINWQDPKDVAKNIGEQLIDPNIALGTKGKGTNTNPGGVPQSYHLPTTFISEFGKILKPMFDGSADKLSGAKDYVTNRSAALPAVALRLAQNKDFQGNPIYGKDKEGNDLGAGKSALNIGDQILPIPFVQGDKQFSGQQGVRDSILNTLGGRVSADQNSAEALKSKDLTKMYDAYNPVADSQRAVSKSVTDLIASDNVNQAHRKAEDWNAKVDTIKRNYPPNIGANAKKAWDDKWDSLKIATTKRATQSRAKSAKASAGLLDLNN